MDGKLSLLGELYVCLHVSYVSVSFQIATLAQKLHMLHLTHVFMLYCSIQISCKSLKQGMY